MGKLQGDPILADLVAADGSSGGFVKDSDRASAAETRAMTSTTAVLTPSNLADRASFRAYLNVAKTDVVDNTYTLVPFDTENYDVGAAFASSLWTPPAGKVEVRGQVVFAATNFTSGDQIGVRIYLNGTGGTILAQFLSKADAANAIYVPVFWSGAVNGTDTIGIYGLGNTTGGGAVTFANGAFATFFEGKQL